MIDIRVLGTLAIQQHDDGAPVLGLTQPKRVALLLYLILAEPPGVQARDSLMALLWPEADDESARHSLRNALYTLRQALGEAALVSRGDNYVGLEPSAVHCDALQVRRLLSARRWEEAVEAWAGELAPGFHVSGAPEFERWLDDQRIGFRSSVTAAAWRRVDELERAGDRGVVAAAERACALDPGDEAGVRRLMRFLDAAVGRAAALRAYGDLAEYLQLECEAEPSAETRALAAELRARSEPPPVSVSRRVDPIVEPAAVRAGQSSPRRRPAAIAGLVGALLMGSLVSVLALRHASSDPPSSNRASTEPQLQTALRLPLAYRRDTAAYASYLRGLSLRLHGSLDESRDTFASLVERNPLYAPALSGLAHVYSLSTVYGSIPPAVGWPRAEAAAQRAIALDSGSASAYLALGAMEIFWHWDLPRAGRLIDRGVALEPADPEAHAIRGVWFRWRMEMDSAVAEARKSLALDPLNPAWVGRLGRQLLLARDYDGAEKIYRQAMQDHPGDTGPYTGLVFVYKAEGRLRDALAMWRAGRVAAGDSAAAAAAPSPATEVEAARWFADQARKRIGVLEEAARGGEQIDAGTFARAYAEVGDVAQSIRWFDSMLVRRDPLVITILDHPTFDPVRDDPRYQAWEAALPWRQGPDSTSARVVREANARADSLVAQAKR